MALNLFGFSLESSTLVSVQLLAHQQTSLEDDSRSMRAAASIIRNAVQHTDRYALTSTLIRSTRRSAAGKFSTQHKHYHSSQPDVLETLTRRGLLKDIAGDGEALRARLQQGPIGVYAGIDPTAPSLHLGHLLPLMVLFWLYTHGHHSVSLIGGATAQVGDPSGRLTSRARVERAVEVSNTEALHKQVAELWERAEAYVQSHGHKKTPEWRRSLLNNADWLLRLNIVDFLKQLGGSMRIGAMLSRDTVKNKMEKGDGMSFAEFTYPLLQGWDWWHMFQHHAVQLQVGGSDQYGNIVAGMEAVRNCAANNRDGRLAVVDDDGNIEKHNTPMGLTTPLLTTSSGEKFGKSAGNAVWLNPSMTSPFDMYGFLLRTSDDDVEQYLKLFTFVSLDTIIITMNRHRADPSRRYAQHQLAHEVLQLVHGPQQAASTAKRHNSMRELDLSALMSLSTSTTTSAESSAPDEPRIKLPASLLGDLTFAKLLHAAGLAQTKSEASRTVKGGGLYVAETAASDAGQEQSEAFKFVQVTNQQPAEITSVRDHRLLILRLGKWKIRIIEFEKTNDVARS